MRGQGVFSRIVQDRFEVIAPYLHAADVLDLGCVDARPRREASQHRIAHKPDLLFKRITEVNPQALGVDVDAEGVAALKAMGYRAECADVETMELGQQFDTIVAGELIEHLENPGLFLRNMRRHLKRTGRLIVSTPNPFYQKQTWKIWRYGRPAVHEDHLHWQDPMTLRQLMERTGLEVVEGCWVQRKWSLFKGWKGMVRGYFAKGFVVVAGVRS